MDYKKAWEELAEYLDGKILDFIKAYAKSRNENRGKDERACFMVKLHLGYIKHEMTRLEKESK